MTRNEARAFLAAAGVPDPATDARRLWDFATGDVELYRDAVARRAKRVPVSQITGRRAFWTSEFRVTPDVLDPRPETEALICLALTEPFTRVLDLGTGSGCILLSLLKERPTATGVGTDISAAAVLVAGENAERMGVTKRVVLPLSNWFDDVGGQFDLIVSNPPYIAAEEMAGLAPEVRDHEPRAALTDEGDGLTAYRKIAAGAPDHLKPGGRLIVEIGPTQAAAVKALFAAAGLEDAAVHPDLDGRDRVVSAKAPE